MGWRIPFLISAVLLLVGYVIRIGVNESPEFAQVLERRERAEMPAKEVLRTAWRTVLLCMGVCTVAIGGIYFTNTFMLSYTTQTLGLNRALILDCLFVVAIIQFLVQPLAAWLADALGPARVLLTAAFCSVLAPYPMFMLVTQERPTASSPASPSRWSSWRRSTRPWPDTSARPSPRLCAIRAFRCRINCAGRLPAA